MSNMLSNPIGHAAFYHKVPQVSVAVLLPKFLVIYAALTLIVGGAVPQLEMALTDGSVPVLPKQLTLLLLGFGSMLLLKKRFQSSPLLPVTTILFCYLLLEVMFLHFSQGLSFGAIRSSLECFLFLITAGIASLVPLQIRSRHILGLLLVITLACLIVSTAQFVTNSPILRTESIDHSFHVQSYQFLSQTRGFSLFANGLEAGVFYSFMGGLATSFCLGRGTRRLGVVLLPLCVFGCYATYTRLAMIGFVVSITAVFVMSTKRFSRPSRLLPLFALTCAVLIVVQGLQTSGGAGRTDLANISTLDQRVIAWEMYGGKFLAGSTTDIIFGIGQAPYLPYGSPDRPENAAPIPVDNAYLLVLLSTGLFGLALFVAAYWRFWTFLHRRATSSGDHLIKGIAGIFATVPFFCAINDLPTQTILLLLLAVSLDDDNHNAIPALSPTTSRRKTLDACVIQ